MNKLTCPIKKQLWTQWQISLYPLCYHCIWPMVPKSELDHLPMSEFIYIYFSHLAVSYYMLKQRTEPTYHVYHSRN